MLLSELSNPSLITNYIANLCHKCCKNLDNVCIHIPLLQILDTMAAPRAKAQPVGSAPWLLNERSQASQFIEQETEEFAMWVRNDMEWLNEHMADVFSKNQLYVLVAFLLSDLLTGVATSLMCSKLLANYVGRHRGQQGRRMHWKLEWLVSALHGTLRD